MRTKFWKRRIAKLDGRLNTVIETTERARKSIQRPPSRVTIDTSYLDMAAQEQEDDDAPFSRSDENCDEQQHFQDGADGSARDFSGNGDGGAGMSESPASDTPRGGEAALALTGSARNPSDGSSEASSGDVLAFEQAQVALIQRAEDAERELEMVRAAVEQQEQSAREIQGALQREIEARQTAEEARDAMGRRADDSEIALAILRTQAEAREKRVHAANGSLEQEMEARRALERERDGLARRVEELEATLDAATVSEGHLSEANRSLERETAARIAAEAERDDMMARIGSGAAELAHVRVQLVELRTALKDAEAAARRELSARRSLEVDLNDAVRKAEVAQADAAALRKMVEARGSTAQEAIEKERDTLLRRAEQAEQRLLRGDALAGSREAALREAVAEQARAVSACRAAEAERDAWARRAVETETEVATLKGALEALQAEPLPVAAPTRAVAHQPAVETLEVAANVASGARAEDAPQRSALRSRLMRKSELEPGAPAATEPTRLPAVVNSEPAAQAKGAATAAGKASSRRDRRVASQMPATLWREGMGQPLACTLRDRSSSGARLEFKHASIIEGFSAFNIGDQVTLTLNSAHEKTWVGCEVVWADGKSCGVRFSGQFRSEGPVTRKPTRGSPADKAPRPKAASRLAAVFSLRGS